MAEFNYEEKTLLNLKEKYEQLIKLSYSRYNVHTPIDSYYNHLYEVEAMLSKIYKKPVITPQLEEKGRRLFNIEFKQEELPVNKDIIDDLKTPLTFYSDEEIETLLNWTTNNTRNNIKNSNFGDDQDLDGVCGFAQFSSLYPLEELELKITINNAASFTNNKIRHAFGTVSFPTIIDEEIKEVTYLIDLTYSQFFLLNKCVENCYLKGEHPSAGYFIKNDPKRLKAAKELLEKGYIKATEENLKDVFYGLYLSTFDKKDVKQAEIDFEQLDLLKIINEEQDVFNYNPEEFRIWGFILNIEDSYIEKL